MRLQIDLPISRWETWGGATAVAGLATLTAFSPVAPWWRLGLFLAALLSAGLSWRRYLQRRPLGLQVTASGQWLLIRSAKDVVPVINVTPGIVAPWLVTIRCRTLAGDWIDLLIPGSALPPREHWRLRREIIGFRAPEPVGLRPR